MPLHGSTVEALHAPTASYAISTCQSTERRRFFISDQGSRLTKRAFNATFVKLIGETGLEGRGQRARPRTHDLRHSFAVRTLLDWYQAGVDVDAQLPLLSTYLGHADPVSSYWYLQAVPELLAIARDRLEQTAGELS